MSSDITYGYSESAGEWTIDFGLLNTWTSQSMNGLAERVVEAFVDAFGAICDVEYAEGDMAELGDDGTLLAFQPEISLDQSDDWRGRRSAPGESVRARGNGVLTRVMLRCGVSVVGPGGGQPLTVLHGGVYFHYESGLIPELQQPAKFDPAYVSVGAEVDPWLDVTLHDGHVLDNRAVAQANRPQLKRALRRWELLVGRPITHVTSVPFPSLIQRHGFKGGVETYLERKGK